MTSRKVALDILDDIFEKGAFSNIALKNRLNNVQLDEKDKALVTEIVYGTVKFRYTIDTILAFFVKLPFKKINKVILNILRISIYQIRYLDKIPDYAVVNEAVDMSKKVSQGASKFVNGVLRNYLRNKEADFYNKADKIDSLCFNYSFEKWMVNLLVSQYGYDTTETILKGLNETPAVSVRINSMKTDVETAVKRLEALNYNVKKGAVYPSALQIIKGSNVEKNPLFKEGFLTVQDESAMLAVDALSLESGMTVLDLCAAPGGKTTHIGEQLKNEGNIYAFDIHENKLSLIRKNAERLGINNIQAGVMNGEVLNSDFIERFHRILVDAPCSGLGIIRKKPEIKWTKELKDTKSLQAIQKSILNNAAMYLMPNGIMVYSTCTLNKNENQEIISDFLANHKNFSLDELQFGERSNLLYESKGMLTILPDNDMDGFFIAKLRKNI